jgi:uncharacterized damage-inducible protein DinB
MQVSDVVVLYEYNCWARDRILSTAEQLDADQLGASFVLSYGSILGTLTHIFNAEHLWRMRCQQRISPTSMRFETPVESLSDLERAWLEESALMYAYVAGLKDSELEEVISYRGLGGKVYENRLWHIFMQLVNHGVQHRAELAAKMNELGKSPGNLDFIIYLSQKAAKV